MRIPKMVSCFGRVCAPWLIVFLSARITSKTRVTALQIDAPPRHVLTQGAEPSCADAFLSCRLSARPPIRDSEQEQPHGTWHQRCRATAGKWAQLWGDASHLTLLLATQGLEPPPSDVRWVCAGACTHLFLGALARRAAQRARAHGTILLWSSAHLRDAEIALCLILTFQARLPGGRESSLLGVGGT